MLNPFSKLKRFRCEGHDRTEDHATECLAMCLRLSRDFRVEFLKFLGLKDLNSDEWEIETQVTIRIESQQRPEDRRLDLLMKSKALDKLILIEVKVDDDLHANQLKAYEKWIADHEVYSEKHLFVLIQKLKDPPKGVGDWTLLNWRDLETQLRNSSPKATTDQSLFDQFRDYLKEEKIVPDYTNILDYGKQWAAESQIKDFFQRVERDLKAIDSLDELEFTSQTTRKGESPSLEIRDPRWESNVKLVLWLMLPWIENNKLEPHFLFQITLWTPHQPGNWQKASKLILEWTKQISSKEKWNPWSVYIEDDKGKNNPYSKNHHLNENFEYTCYEEKNDTGSPSEGFFLTPNALSNPEDLLGKIVQKAKETLDLMQTLTPNLVRQPIQRKGPIKPRKSL